MRNVKAMIVLLCCAAGTAFAGPDWIERGDAGSVLGDAQAIVGIGAPRTIAGSLSSSFLGDDFEDLYLITILEPTSFSFTILNATFDSQLYLFALSEDDQLFGILSNDDANPMTADAAIAQSFATDATGARVVYPGLYGLAITTSGRFPVSDSGSIFFQATRTEISGPDGPGQYGGLTGWDGPGGSGSYAIELDGIGYADIPSPGTMALVAAGCVVSMRRRR